jgi:hypothetical protein
MTFPAKWRGSCEACPEPIYKGQEISSDGAGGYVHAECGSPRIDDDLEKPVCPVCWLILPCGGHD